jgi:hypothetical protein
VAGTDFELAFLDMRVDTEAHYGRMARSRSCANAPELGGSPALYRQFLFGTLVPCVRPQSVILRIAVVAPEELELCGFLGGWTMAAGRRIRDQRLRDSDGPGWAS